MGESSQVPSECACLGIIIYIYIGIIIYRDDII